MAQLAQTYIHLQPYEITRARIGRLGDRVKELALNAGRDIYGGNVTIDVRLEGGSLKSWVTVVGIITAIHVGYDVISDYAGFKESIGELCNDARKFGVDVCGEFTHAAGASDNQIYRTEKRLKAPGKIMRIIKKVETVDQMAGKLHERELKRQLDSIERDLKALERDMSPEEMRNLRHTFTQSSPLKNLPDRRALPEMPRVAVRVQNVQPELLPLGTPHQNGQAVSFPSQPTNRLTYHETVFVPPL